MRAATSWRARLSTVATTFLHEVVGHEHRLEARRADRASRPARWRRGSGRCRRSRSIGILDRGPCREAGGARGGRRLGLLGLALLPVPDAGADREQDDPAQDPAAQFLVRSASSDRVFRAYMGLTVVDTCPSGIIPKVPWPLETVPLPLIPPILIPLTPELPPKECADCAFLLDAVGIPYERRTTATGASLWVAPEHHARAAHELRDYLRENPRPAAAAGGLAAPSARALRRVRLCDRAGRRDARAISHAVGQGLGLGGRARCGIPRARRMVARADRAHAARRHAASAVEPRLRRALRLSGRAPLRAGHRLAPDPARRRRSPTASTHCCIRPSITCSAPRPRCSRRSG